MASHAHDEDVPRHRAAHHVVLRRGVPAASVAAAACAALGLTPGVGNAEPGPAGSRQAVEQHIAQLYQQAETATQQYDATAEHISRLQAQIAAAQGEAGSMRRELDKLEGGLGQLAAEQYRNPGYTATLDLLFSTHPDTYLQRADIGSRMAALNEQEIHTAAQTRERLDELHALGSQELEGIEQAEAQLARQRAAIEGELADARGQLASLDAADRRAVTVALAQGAGASGDGLGTTVPAQAPPLGSLLDAVNAAVGEGVDVGRAQRAISAAYSELGKPYVWGAVGPGGFDCSGLMQHVWGVAGIMLPRTSEEQADIGPSVPITDIQPGDLVIYFSGRTHVGLYVGKGLVIHAPRPGSQVQFASLEAMPISKIVRPYGG